MPVIINDSSVIIDLAKVRLIEPVLGLPYAFYIPDVLYHNELLSLGSHTREELLEAGFILGELDGDGVDLVFSYAATYPVLTDHDCFALALARSTEALLLTGDGNLRKAAQREDVRVHGLLWLCDQMNDHGTTPHPVLLEALEHLAVDPTVRLPARALNWRIQRLRARVEAGE